MSSRSNTSNKRAEAKTSLQVSKSWWYAHFIALALFAALLAIGSGQIGTYIQTRITEPALFNLRMALGQNPEVPKNLKILALDDATFAFLGAPKPRIEDLSLLIENIRKRQPKAIIIDSLMADNPGEDKVSIERLLSASDRTYTGAFLSPYDIKYKNPLDTNRKVYQISNYMNQQWKSHNSSGSKLSKKIDWRIYGPWLSLSKAFKAQGHLSYNKDGTISPFYQINEQNVIPHISLFAANDIFFVGENLFINRNIVPLTTNGGVPINYRSPKQLYNKTYALIDSLKRARNNLPESSIKPGDIVFIVFGFSTGSTDFHEFGPYGQIPGAFIVANMIADIELGTWIKRMEPLFLFITIGAVLGIIVGINITSRLFWLITCIIVGVALTSSASLFISHNIILPWFLPTIAFLGTAIIYFANTQIEADFRYLDIERSYYLEKNLRIEKEHERLKLEGFLSLGKTVQKLLLPNQLQGVFGDYRYKMYYNPSLKMAGDWLHVWNDTKGQLRIFMGDVVGKGPSAAIPVASIITILHECQELDLDPDETFQRLNRKLIELYKGLVTTTAQAVVLTEDHRCIIYNAGSSGWFVKKQKETQAHNMRSNPLGMMDKLIIPSKEIEFTKRTDILFSFTDGYIESSREMRSFKRKLDTFNANRLSIEALHQLLIDCQRNSEAKDDKTLLVIERTSSIHLERAG